MAQSDLVKTRILILSDTHSALPFDPAAAAAAADDDDNADRLPFTWPLPRADVVLHAGDLTGNGADVQHERAVELLRRIDAPLKIVIPGNHDITLDRAYYAANPRLHAAYGPYGPGKLAEIEQLYVGADARAAGIEYLVEGTRSFHVASNGATLTLFASAYQPEFCRWAFAYPRHVDRFTALLPPPPPPQQQQQQPAVDIMLTHGPPLGLLDRTWADEHVGCAHLRRAVERVRPRLSCFGHIHEAWGALRKDWTGTDDGAHDYHYDAPDAEACFRQRGAYIDATSLRPGRETLFVNASIMNRAYRPRQAPWIVDLMLPRRDNDGSGRLAV